MGRLQKRSSRNRKKRQQIAQKSIVYLSNVLFENISSNIEVADSAARQILGIGRRHGIRPESGIRKMLCRDCLLSLSPGKTARVRISSGKLAITCLRCKRLQRFKI